MERPDAIINFCTSHVSLGNSSYPRGMVFHGDGLKSPQKHLYLPLFPASKRMCPVFRLQGFTNQIKEVCMFRIQQYIEDSYISPETSRVLIDFLQQNLLTDQILTHQYYSEQITRLNNIWWKKLFPHLPDYIPLDAESMVCEILRTHLQNNTVLTRIMTDNSIQSFIEQYFNSISCCFNLTDKTGTYLFWHLDENNVRHALWRE